MDIIIYTTEEKLAHKQGKVKDSDYSDIHEYYWLFNRMPKNIDLSSKIYFATKGFIKGYFEILDIEYHSNEIIFDCRTWKDLNKPIPTKSFQGFKYKK